MTLEFNRSPILSFYELDESQQIEMKSLYDNNAENDSYVLLGKQPLPLGMFLRIPGNHIWNGIYGTSAFSAYLIKFNNRGDQALVASKYW